MLSILFWNLDGKPHRNAVQRAENLIESIGRLAAVRQVDILVFAECGIEEGRLIERLDATGIGPFQGLRLRTHRIRVFTRLQPSSVIEVFGDRLDDRLSMLQIERDVPPGILLAGVHFHDRMRIPTEVGRALAVTTLARSIENVEDEAGHQRTVLVGDLNMNPFEGGVVGADALHAVMTRGLAKTIPRLASRQSRRCFYNPMWGHFGDRSQGPPGTYYYQNADDPANHFWNMYDQVLLRPELMGNLVRVDILDSDGEHPFTSKNGRPRQATFSDHLPILVQLDV